MSIRTIMKRAFVVSSLSAIVLVVAAPVAFATAEPSETPPVQTVPEGVEVPDPAIPIVEDAPADAEPEWTFRFLVPTALALGAIAVVGTIIAYFVKVTKARYRIVE